jgi:hypothetical protein
MSVGKSGECGRLCQSGGQCLPRKLHLTLRRRGHADCSQPSPAHILPLRAVDWTSSRIIPRSGAGGVDGSSNAKMRLRVRRIVWMRCHHVGVTHGLCEIRASNSGLERRLMRAARGVRGHKHDAASSCCVAGGSHLAWMKRHTECSRCTNSR